METTSDSLATFQPILTHNNPTKILHPVPPPFSLSRIGSGTSVVTDLEAGMESESSSKYKKGVSFLFGKVMSASDVGRECMLVPKHHAEKHFPLPESGKWLMLEFEDADGKAWRFAYSFRKSGIKNKYTLRKDWCRFVKDKDLKAGDTVLFYKSTTFDNQFYIDFIPTFGSGSGSGSGQQVGPPER